MYKLKKAYIRNWRKLKNLELDIADRITLISGQNGVGKSNLLSLFAAGSGTPISFQALNKKKLLKPEFDSFFHINTEELDKNYFIVLEYSFKKGDIEKVFYKKLRLKNDTNSNRSIRIIPETICYNGNMNSNRSAAENLKSELAIGKEARVPLPTCFLSISRLFPLGETASASKGIRANAKDYSDYYNKYQEWYNMVLPNSITIGTSSFEEINKPVTTNKSYYMNLMSTTPLTQSVGQDNLGCIISALLDFYILYKTNIYSSGILCIDEIDVSLHPDAQIKLINLLESFSKKYNIQIIISSHSLTVIKEVLKLKKRCSGQYHSLGYLKNNQLPFFKENPTYDGIKKDLFLKTTSHSPKLKVYFEDNVGMKLFKLLKNTLVSLINLSASSKTTSNEQVKKTLEQITEIPAFIGSNSLKRLPTLDSYFETVLIICDGDVNPQNSEVFKWENTKEYLNNNQYNSITETSPAVSTPKNIIYLPSIFSPELYLYRIIWDYVENEDAHLMFWRGLDDIPDLNLNSAQFVREKLFKDTSTLSKNFVKGLSKDLLEFAEKSEILFDYYKNEKHITELNMFFDNFNNEASLLLKKLKASLL